MRPALLFVVSLSACGLVASACGLTARGTLEADGEAGASEPDAAIDAGADAPTDAAPDAEVEAAPCLVTVEDPFATTQFDPARWLVTANPANAGAGLPQVVFTGQTSQAKLVSDTVDNVRGAIWHTEVVPLEAFDIAFDAYAVCGASCGDGLAVVWLETATPAELGDAGDGATLGIPRGLAGGAVALDLADNVDRGESVDPAMTVLDIDGSDLVATPYDWVTATSGAMTVLVNNGARRIDLSMRAKVVSVKVDGVDVVKGTIAHLPSEGVFGFTAASGSFNAQLAVGDVRAKFYRCNAP